ncbi:MAG: alpha-hydroxy acid oxidase [Pseudomonadota bacterium]
MDLDVSHPAISDLRRAARGRIPHFAFEFLDSATGAEKGALRNRQRLDAVQFLPAILTGEMTANLETETLGTLHAYPFGIAPIGLAGIIWPEAERQMAAAARRHRIPYGQSTVAAATPEETGPIAGEMGWFQHYPVSDPAIRLDMLKRVKAAGWRVLVVTLDLPGESRRERQRRAEVRMPPKLTPRMIWSMARCPAWSFGMARAGMPRMAFPASYVKDRTGPDAFLHAGRLIRGFPDEAYLQAVRNEWDGPLVVKGIQDPRDVDRLIKIGADAIWVSNHTGRQFEGGPAAIDRLPLVAREVAGRVPVYYCSGIEGGLDILRAVALGADFVFLGKAWYFALAALGHRGIDHLVHILKADLEANMSQLGATSIRDVAARLMHIRTP